MYRNYIFDLYGTLIDIHTDEEGRQLWKIMAGILTRRGAAWRPDGLKSAYRSFSKEAEERRRKETGSSWPEMDLAEVIRRLYEEAPGKSGGPAVTDALIQSTADELRTLSMRRFRLYTHAADVLKALRKQGGKVYLLSNAQRLFTIPELRQTHIADLFDAVYLSSDAGIRKPDPEFLQKLLREQNLRREESLLVGNELDTDMETAARCGVRGVFLNTYGVMLQDVKLWQDKMRKEGIEPDLQMQMSGDIRYVLRMQERGKEKMT